jgi:ABC-type polysaccharide/polyol phosphate export permease
MWRNLAQLVHYRPLVQSLVVRDLKARYRGSVLGVFWSFINPLMLLSIYSFVFSTVLAGTRGPDTTPFPLFLFCGLLPWSWFTTALNESAVSLISAGNLIRKVLFPAEVLPLVSVIATMVHFFVGLLILAIFEITWQHHIHLTDLVWLPVVIAIQFVFTTGLGMLLAALTVHFRDVRDLVSNLLTFWFFATPIVYPSSLVPGRWQWVYKLNPFYHLAVSYQDILFSEAPFSHTKSVLLVGALSIALFVAGYWVFDRLRDSFAEAV